MKLPIVFCVLLSGLVFSCSPAKKAITSAISQKDMVVVLKDSGDNEALIFANTVKENFKNNQINFSTFSAKIKVETEDAKGKNPDLTAVIRMVKDSAIWLSLSATFLNVEVFRLYITKDSVILLDKRERTVQYRRLDYLQEVTQIPLDFATLQNLIIGNAIFFSSDSAIIKKADNYILINAVDNNFKNLLTLKTDNYQLDHIKLDDVNVMRNRTADITYAGYQKVDNINFSTLRDITIVEKNKLQVTMEFKQFEFNKDLSVAFPVPKNYKIK